MVARLKAGTGRFVWYELMATDVAAAASFYANVVGWSTRDSPASGLNYTLFAAGGEPVAGLLDLPEEGRRNGATPRWLGYVGVDDVDADAERLKRLGGTVYVPPTNSNIGRITIVGDPQTATLALVQDLKFGPPPAAAPFEPGHVGWHELFAADSERALAFYGDLFGWRRVDDGADPEGVYRLFSAGAETLGGIFNKPPTVPAPFWLFYLNVEDLDAASLRVQRSGGRIFEGPIELPGQIWIARGVDPQGAVFALRGTRTQEAIARDPAAEIGWSSSWGGYSSRGRLVVNKRRP